MTIQEMKIGDSASTVKTIGESDVYLFAGITGDLNPAHTDEVIEAYNAVTAEDVRALARELFDFSRVSLSAVGRVGDEDYYRGLIGN